MPAREIHVTFCCIVMHDLHKVATESLFSLRFYRNLNNPIFVLTRPKSDNFRLVHILCLLPQKDFLIQQQSNVWWCVLIYDQEDLDDLQMKRPLSLNDAKKCVSDRKLLHALTQPFVLPASIHLPVYDLIFLLIRKNISGVLVTDSLNGLTCCFVKNNQSFFPLKGDGFNSSG